MSNKKEVVVIGAGFAGIAAASNLAKDGYKVTLVEKHDIPGGRARVFHKDGFTFDMGPSWYWMPDVFDKYFARFGKKVADYYNLVQLSPSFTIYFNDGDFLDVPDQEVDLYELFEKYEPGSSAKLRKFLADAAYKYDAGINDLVLKPSLSIKEFISLKLVRGVLGMGLTKSFHKFARQYFKNPKLLQLVEFPILFLGATAHNTPSLYNLMNHSSLVQGTFYPMGGMHEIIKGMVKLAKELGVEFKFSHNVTGFEFQENKVKAVVTEQGTIPCDVVVGGADYHHIEQSLLPLKFRKYTPKYWADRKLAPSCLLYYIGLNKRLKNMHHHMLFFDADFELHAEEIYKNPQWPSKPLFYTCCPSVTDKSVAPEGQENLFLLVPVATDLEDTEEVRAHYFDLIMNRLEKATDQDIRSSIVCKTTYAQSNFKKDYNALRGNAYGLANTLDQTAILKPSIKNPKLQNFYYTGQLTVPGPGVPPSLISGQIVAEEIAKNF
jgi:phytoene desaturase